MERDSNDGECMVTMETQPAEVKHPGEFFIKKTKTKKQNRFVKTKNFTTVE